MLFKDLVGCVSELSHLFRLDRWGENDNSFLRTYFNLLTRKSKVNVKNQLYKFKKNLTKIIFTDLGIKYVFFIF